MIKGGDGDDTFMVDGDDIIEGGLGHDKSMVGMVMI